MTTISVREIRYTDQGALLETFPNADPQQVQADQLAYMLGERLVLVARDTRADQHLVGVLKMQWQSDYTRFWQRHIPEIVAVQVVESDQTDQIIGQLISAAARIVHERGHRNIGWLLPSGTTSTWLKRAEALGFQPDKRNGAGASHWISATSSD